MEEILKLILTKLDGLESGQASLQSGFAALENRQATLESGFAALQNGQATLESGFAALQNGQTTLQTGQDIIAQEQTEMRKEVAFYYSNMMKKLDDNKHELSSEITQLGKIQKEHQQVLEFLNEK